MGRFLRRVAAACAWGILACAFADAAALRVATWNVRNYNVCDRLAEGVFRKEYPKPEGEKAALRAVLCATNADVLALQEMGGAPFLEELRRDLKREGLDYPYAAQIETADPDRTLAVLSRVPFAAVRRHEPVPTEIGIPVRRGVLETAFETNGVRWRLFCVHLKSRVATLEGDAGAARQRRAEARAAARIVAASPDAETLVAGDFNDNARSAALRAFVGSAKNAPDRLRALFATDGRGEIWTHFYAGGEVYERFDFMLVSAPMARRVRAARIADSPSVLQASDHRLVYVDFEF